jgi:hypothetical protein
VRSDHSEVRSDGSLHLAYHHVGLVGVDELEIVDTHDEVERLRAAIWSDALRHRSDELA